MDAFRAEEERRGREFAARVAPWQDFFAALFTEVFGTVLEHTRTHQEEQMPDQSIPAAIGGVTYIPMPFELIAGQQAWTLIELDELARTYFVRATPLNLEEVGRHRHDPDVPAAVLAGPELHAELRATAAEAEAELNRQAAFAATLHEAVADNGALLREARGTTVNEGTLARGVSFRSDPEMIQGTWGVALRPDGYEQSFVATDFTPELVATLALNGIRAFDLAPDVYEGRAPYLSAAEMMGRLQEIPAAPPVNDGVSWAGEINGCDVMAADWLENDQWAVEGQRLTDLSVRAVMAALLLDARKPDIAVPAHYGPILTQLAETDLSEWSTREADLEAAVVAEADSGPAIPIHVVIVREIPSILPPFYLG